MDLLGKLVDTVGIALIGINAPGRIVFSNPAAGQLFGHAPAQMAKLSISDLLPAWPSDGRMGATLPPAVETVLRPIHGRHRNGNLMSLAVHVTLPQIQADALRYTLVLRDIGKELLAEQLSKEEAQRMAYAVNGAKIGVFEVDMLLGTSHVSGAWRELMEIAPDEDIDTQVDWRKRVHPDDLPDVAQADLDCIEGRSSRSLKEYRLRKRDGTGWRWMQSDAVAGHRDGRGVATRLIGAQTDITARKNAEAALRKSERQFRSAMEYAPIGMALVGLNGRWLRVNPAMCRILGYTEQELLATDFQAITHPDDLAKDIDHLKRLLSGHEQTYAIEKRYCRPDGTVVWGHLVVALVRHESGEPLHFISQVVDITDRHRLERMKRDFTATVSHELRAPVTAISAALDLIDVVSLGALPDNVRKLISISRRNCGQLRLLLDDILDFEKLGSDKMSIKIINANVISAAESSIRATQPYAANHNVTLTLDAPDQAIFCEFDPARLQQVLTNLLTNAAKFSHNGGQVVVGVVDEKTCIRVSVADQGIGIPAGFDQTIFEPFSQVDPSDTRERGGTGLGLSISKQLIERMGGSIGFDRPRSGGTDFWIRLPVGR